MAVFPNSVPAFNISNLNLTPSHGIFFLVSLNFDLKEGNIKNKLQKEIYTLLSLVIWLT